MKFYWYLRLHIKIICRRFHITRPFSFWDIRTRDIWNVCLQTYKNNRICWKLAYFLRKIQTWRVNNSRILRIRNAKCSGYCFHMNPNTQWNFQICIGAVLRKLSHSKFLRGNKKFVHVDYVNLICKILHLFNVIYIYSNNL